MNRMAYSKAHAAEALDVAPRTIDCLIATGQLRAIRIGRRVLILKRELERFTEERIQSETSKSNCGAIEKTERKVQLA